MEGKNNQGNMNSNQNNDGNNKENKPLEIPENDSPRETKPARSLDATLRVC